MHTLGGISRTYRFAADKYHAGFLGGIRLRVQWRSRGCRNGSIKYKGLFSCVSARKANFFFKKVDSYESGGLGRAGGMCRNELQGSGIQHLEDL